MTAKKAIEILKDTKWSGSSDAHETYEHSEAVQTAINALMVIQELPWIDAHKVIKPFDEYGRYFCLLDNERIVPLKLKRREWYFNSEKVSDDRVLAWMRFMLDPEVGI